MVEHKRKYQRKDISDSLIVACANVCISTGFKNGYMFLSFFRSMLPFDMPLKVMYSAIERCKDKELIDGAYACPYPTEKGLKLLSDVQSHYRITYKSGAW